MATSAATSPFSLVDEPWIPVLDAAGRRRDVSLLGLFEQAGELRMIACELPTQTFALLRLALAILHRVTAGPNGEAAWLKLWNARELPQDDIAAYLGEYWDRFDLLHPQHPFYQVADLRPGNDNAFGLEKLIADIPNGMQFLTTRAGRGTASITPAEAAVWLVHSQAYDVSGIKTGAVGDLRVRGGRGYPIGVAAAGRLGGVYMEGANLLETLLLNLVPVAPGWQQWDERDEAIWERPSQTAAEEPEATRGPFGVLGLLTWQSRRIRLFGDRGGITGAMIANGDRLEWQDRHQLEPMSVWGRSGPREKEQKRTPIYLPRPHDHTRALWRGLQTLLPPPSASANEPAQRLTPMVVSWLAHLTLVKAVSSSFPARPRATSIVYGSQQAVIAEVFTDGLTMQAQLLLEESPLRQTAIDSTTDAEGAVRVLRTLAVNLVRSAGGSSSGTGEAERAGEQAYANLDHTFRTWLARLGPTSEPLAERRAWQRQVWRTVAALGADMVGAAGSAAWAGRTIRDSHGQETYYSSAQAEAWFRSGLAKALPMAFADGDTSPEVSS